MYNPQNLTFPAKKQKQKNVSPIETLIISEFHH